MGKITDEGERIISKRDLDTAYTLGLEEGKVIGRQELQNELASRVTKQLEAWQWLLKKAGTNVRSV